MIFKFGAYTVDVDVERTREFYDKHGITVIEDCGCNSCYNYYHAISKCSQKVKHFFDILGIDPLKSPEATFWFTDENNIAHYTVLFNLVGTIIKSVDIYKPVYPKGAEQIPGNFHEIDRDFTVGFHSEYIFPVKDFPQPCIGLEINVNLPWILK